MSCTSENIIDRVRHQLDHAHRISQSRDVPFVTMTYAQSLDGCIARSQGETLQLSNPLSQELTHQVRALHDAILVGINTVLCDNPRLNVRLVNGNNPQPVVVDSRLRFPLTPRLLRDPCVRPIVVTGSRASDEKERRLTDAGARVVRVRQQPDGRLDLPSLFRKLKQLGLRSVMVEGGASIITSVLTCRLADQYVLTISPRFVGGLRAVQVQDASTCDYMPRLRNMHYQWLAEDLILRGDLDRASDESSDGLIMQDAAGDHSRPLGDPRNNGGSDQR